MKQLPILVYLVFQLWALPLAAQQHQETFLWNTEQGWFGERILLPPGFAPTMTWKGLEEIRFAPGMFKSDQPDFFSYALVFSLEPDADISQKALDKQILTYYQGLSFNVSKGRGRQVDISNFKVTSKPVEEKESTAPKQAKDPKVYKTILNWTEPFATGKPQKLNIDVHAWKDTARKRTYVFFLATPTAEDSEIYKKLVKIRKNFVIK